MSLVTLWRRISGASAIGIFAASAGFADGVSQDFEECVKSIFSAELGGRSVITLNDPEGNPRLPNTVSANREEYEDTDSEFTGYVVTYDENWADIRSIRFEKIIVESDPDKTGFVIRSSLRLQYFPDEEQWPYVGGEPADGFKVEATKDMFGEIDTFKPTVTTLTARLSSC
ncbi:MAG: hypothetical protein AAF988_04845 [Pseudomonadota bacterium]